MSRAGENRQRYVLLDRDGVINRDRRDSVCTIDEFEMLPGAAEAIAALNEAGYGVIVITNQACVGRGRLSLRELERIHDRMRGQVAARGGRIADVFVCPHTDADDCDCRKPRPGLIERAQRAHGFLPAATWFLGDSIRDVDAAVAAGCRPALVRCGKPLAGDPGSAVPVFADLAAFASGLTTGSRQAGRTA